MAATRGTRPRPAATARAGRASESETRRGRTRDFLVTLGEESHEVRLAEVGGGYEVTVGGQTFRVDSRRLNGTCVRSILIDHRSYEADVRELGGGRYSVVLEGDSLELEVRDRLVGLARRVAAARRQVKAETVASPMPGLVVAVEVAVGDTVEPGRAVAIVEAMKMQNELPTIQGGRVREVKVRPGQVVQSGQALVVLEPEE